MQPSGYACYALYATAQKILCVFYAYLCNKKIGKKQPQNREKMTLFPWLFNGQGRACGWRLNGFRLV
jgi:hypothetical protein